MSGYHYPDAMRMDEVDEDILLDGRVEGPDAYDEREIYVVARLASSRQYE